VGTGLAEEDGEIFVEGGLAAGEAGDAEVFGARICDGTLEDCAGELVALVRPGGGVTVQSTQVAAPCGMDLQNRIFCWTHERFLSGFDRVEAHLKA